MREIKFRAWNGEQILYSSDFDFIDFSQKCFGFADGNHHSHFLNIDQFTGKHDYDGDEIYFGDILKTPGGQILVVEADDLITGDPKFIHIILFLCKIIGNIHENPELLK